MNKHNDFCVFVFVFCVVVFYPYVLLHSTQEYRSEGFALTGYVVPGCVEDGAWMLWENSSVAAVAVAAAVAFWVVVVVVVVVGHGAFKDRVIF